MNIKGVIFDMDGLLVDSERLLAEAWHVVGARHGYDVGEQILSTMRGGSLAENKKKLQNYFGPSFDADKMYEERNIYYKQLIAEQGLPIKKGARELLSFLKEHGYKIALATASQKERAVANLTPLGIAPYFEAFICGDMVSKCKPDPEIFLTAAKALELEPGECMVLEDSLNGIAAAYAGGFVPVMVPDITPPTEETLSQLYAKFDSLLEVIDLLDKNEQ